MKRKRLFLRKKIFGFTFRKPQLLDAALTHPSYRNEHRYENPIDFDRLEFFGDSILNFVTCRKLVETFPEADEGFLSRLRSILVSRKILARIAGELGLPRFIRLGRSLTKQGKASKSKIFADSFEALIAALYLDRGFNPAEQFILKNFRGYFDARRLFRLDPNPKSTLQELAQKHWQKLPIYSSEPSGGGIKTVVSIHASRKSAAHGRSRKESEERAARLLLRQIRQELDGRSGRLTKRSSGKKVRKTF